MYLHHEPTKAGLGAIVRGLDVALGVTASEIIQLKRLLQAHRVLIFPRQHIDEPTLVDFALRFGPPFIPPTDSPVLGSDAGAPPEIVVVANSAAEYARTYLGHQEVLPHSDHQWLMCPSSASLLYAVDVPPHVASTTWIDLIGAYADLDTDIRRTIDGLRLVTYNPFFRPFGSVVAAYVDRATEVPPGQTFPHPLVRTHPETGGKILYLNCAYEVEIEGMRAGEGAALVGMLREHLMKPQYHYEHRWQNGDLVFWDNQCTLHFRHAFDPGIRRVLKRVSLGGSRPF